MKTIKLWLIATTLPMLATAQTARTEIEGCPDLAAGKYFAYQAPEVKLTPAPRGYKPFYISAFARHGSRYLTKEHKYTRPLSVLHAADEAGVLSDDGQRAMSVIESLAGMAEGRYGELTPKGAHQHEQLIERMVETYPAVFTDGARIDARSTYKTRAFLSMAAACTQLKSMRPGITLTMDASLHDAYYMKYKNPAYEDMHLANADSAYRAADSVYIHPARLMSRLFTDTAYIAANIDGVQMMQDLFELHGISQSSYDAPGLGFLFEDEELYDLWQRNNFEWYYEKGPSPLSGACMYKLGRNLLENFVLTADTVIASGRTGVTLRYGHDTQLAPLAALMGCGRLTEATADWQRIADTYRTYRIIPMCGNVQMGFYRKAGSTDILVRVMLNERDADLPVKTDCAPFYHWSDLRKYWMDTVKSITLPDVITEDDRQPGTHS